MIRNTRQRDAIRQVFERIERPLNPQDVLDEAKADCVGIGIATVYRNIKVMVEDHTLQTVEIPGGQLHYELAGKAHHHHFHCRECNRVYEVDGCVGNFQSIKPKGFQLEDHEVILYGLCEECVTAE